MTDTRYDIIILGAGLTGLTLAYYLKKAGKKVLILEKELKTGGVINTISEDGFIYETGPNTGVLSTTELVTLFDDLKHRCSLETANPRSKKRYILKGGKWQPLPSGLISAVGTPLFTLKDKFRILAEPFRKQGNDPDETIAQLVIRRMGKSFLDYAVDPFISGIYAGDPNTLVTRFALPKLYALEQNYGSFIRGAVKKGREPKTEGEKRVTKEVFSSKGGFHNLISALTVEVGNDSILTGIRETRVETVNSGFSVSFIKPSGDYAEYSTPRIVTTFGGTSLQELLPFISGNSLKPVTALRYAGVVQVAAGYKNWSGVPLDAFGGLVPAKENRNVLGILFPSAIFKGRAPENGALLSVFLGGIKKPEIIKKSDSEIREIVLKEIGDTLDEKNQPEMLRIFRYKQAIPQYEKSTGERIECIQSLEKKYPGLILAGNIRDGIGMADRVKQAKMISDLILKQPG